MIFVESNFILRYLTGEEGNAQRQAATTLFRQIAEGSILATTSEVVLHEVSYLLTARQHYGLAPQEVIDYWRSILQWRGWSFQSGELETYLRAFDPWELHPKLEFSDAVIAARCEQGGQELATFDRHFDALPFVYRWSHSGS